MNEEKLSPRALAKKQQILDAARTLFLKNGFNATSMDAITFEASVSKQTLYSYFSNKDELFREVLDELIQQNTPDQLKDNYQPTLHTRDDLQELLTEFAQNLIDHLMNPTYLAMIRMMFSELQRFPKLGKTFREVVPERLSARAARLLEQAHLKNIAFVPDLDVATRLFMGPLIIHVVLDGLLVVDHDPQPPTPERIRQLVAAFMQAIPKP